jgi:hypothetical protein
MRGIAGGLGPLGVGDRVLDREGVQDQLAGQLLQDAVIRVADVDQVRVSSPSR